MPNETLTPSRQAALDQAIDGIHKTYGKGAIMRLGEASQHLTVESIPTGALTLDQALGVGGVPRGRVIEVYGPESSGKTTLALAVIARAHAMGGTAAFIDVEHALDPTYAVALGVDVENLLISQPDCGEQALEIVEQLVRSGALDVIVLDSVAALVPRAEIEGEMGDAHVGLQARLMSQAMRKLTSCVSKTRTAAIFINQIREKVGVMFGSPETTPGGRALKFFASVRLDIRRKETIKQGGDSVGSRVQVKVVKNKVAPPFRVADFDIVYGKGISSTGCLLDLAAEAGVVSRSGTWYSFREERLGQGRDNARAHLDQNPALAVEIENALRQTEFFGGQRSSQTEAA
ncbi:MAG: recombinase RecA [Armatimonadetes bacterium]|nr:recombinase RecA [Armatimonadota bacterium]